MERDRAAHHDAEQRLARRVRQPVEVAADPAGRAAGLAAAAPAVHPDAHRREVAEVGGPVADAPHDRDLPLVVHAP